jgi:hypothetical protein
VSTGMRVALLVLQVLAIAVGVWLGLVMWHAAT